MHVVTNRRMGVGREYVTHLLRRSYRVDGRVRNETLANLSHLPEETIALIRGSLRGERYLPAESAFVIERSLPHGHVEAVLCMMRRLGLARLVDREPSRERDLVLAMVAQRVCCPASKLASARGMRSSTLGDELGVADADADALYTALDWLGERQDAIERRLARRHLADRGQVLYDVSSLWFAGRCCPLAQLGFSRDGRRGTPQLIYGLVCDRVGRPVAIHAYPGGVHDLSLIHI